MNLILLQPDLRAYETQHNLKAIESLVEKASGRFSPSDIILLPEHFSSDDSPQHYDDYVRMLAGKAGCVMVGGSHHRRLNGKRVNFGRAVDGKGNDLGTYSKLRPYFEEQNHVLPGEVFGEFEIGGKNILVLICADFWFSDLILRAVRLPDLVLVPSLSVSRKSSSDYSRSIWRHLAVTRAYEFGVFVGISDWSENSSLPKYRACGVGGFADPTSVDPASFFRPISTDGFSVYPLDFDALEAFRSDRRMRGFFWK